MSGASKDKDDSSSKASYADMKKAQTFFGRAIELCMKGGLAELKQVATEFVQKNPEHTLQEVFQSFQSEGKTFLHIACSGGHEDVFEYVFQLCLPTIAALVNGKDKQGFTPLMNATISEKTSIMRKLLQHGADANIQNNDGAAAIHFAAADGSVERINLLFKHNANASLQSQAGNALHWAAGKGRVDAINALLSHNDVDVNALSPTGLPAVFLCAVSACDEGVALLVNAGADVGNIVTGNLTLLHICAENGLLKAVQAIAATTTGSKCCLVKTTENNTPLDLAAMASHRAIVEFLLPLSSEVVDTTNVDEILARGAVKMTEWLNQKEVETNRQEQQLEQQEIAGTATNKYNIHQLFEELMDTTSENAAKADSHKTAGNAAFKNKQFAEAIVHYSKAIELDNKNATTWSNRSACYLATNEAMEAWRDAEICRRLNPHWSKGCYRLAMARLALGHYEDAAVAAFEGCKLDGENKELKELMQKAVRLGREEHEKSLKVQPSSK